MKYSLRSLMIAAILLPPLLAFIALEVRNYVIRHNAIPVKELIHGGSYVPGKLRPLPDSDDGTLDSSAPAPSPPKP